MMMATVCRMGGEEYGLNPLVNSDADTNIEDIPDYDELGQPYTNLAEYKNGTNPTTTQYINFAITIHDVVDTSVEITQSWLPEYDGTVMVKAKWLGADQDAPATVMFSLKETSRYLGRAVNDPDPANMAENHYPDWYDYDGYDYGLVALYPTDAHSLDQDLDYVGQSPASDGIYYIAYMQSWDFGGRTKVLVASSEEPDHIGLLWVPLGSGTNGIGDAWSFDAGDTLVPNADVDRIDFDQTAYPSPLGDDFTNFEEYRGIVYTATIPGDLAFKRLIRIERICLSEVLVLAMIIPLTMAMP